MIANNASVRERFGIQLSINVEFRAIISFLEFQERERKSEAEFPLPRTDWPTHWTLHCMNQVEASRSFISNVWRDQTNQTGRRATFLSSRRADGRCVSFLKTEPLEVSLAPANSHVELKWSRTSRLDSSSIFAHSHAM